MRIRKPWRLAALAGAALIAMPSICLAQNGRLFDRPLPARAAPRPGVISLAPTNQMYYDYPESPDIGPTINSAGWLSAPLPPPRELRKNDLVTIRVDIASRTLQQGEVERRKTSNFDAFLRNWVTLEGLTSMRTAPNQNDQPRVQSQLNGQNRSQGSQLTSESMKFDIAATVADILPNGNIVLEARRKVKNNEEVWLVALSGVCNRDAIGPGNIILSKDIYALEVTKEEEGMVRDTYQRGWLQRTWDRVKLF